MTESKEDPGAAPEPERDPAPEDPLERDGALAGEGGPEVAAAPEEETESILDAPTIATRRRLRAAVALTLVAAIIVFGALGGARLAGIPSETPSPTPHPARLVAVDANGALATMDGGGGSVVSYPAPGVQFGFPAWSPDGTHISATGLSGGSGVIEVFAVAPPGATGAAGSAPVTATDSGAATGAAGDEPGVIYRSSDAQPFYLYWTPDSRQVGFLTQEANGISLRIAPADGSAAATTIRQGAPLYWDWVDPGRLLAHIGGTGLGAFVGEVGLDGRPDDATVITPDTSLSPGTSAAPGTPVSPGVFRSPAVSRDGRYRAYVEVASGAAEEIVLEARDGSSKRTLAVPGATAVEFDPTGASLAYVAPVDATAQPADLPLGPLRLMDPTSGSTRTLLGSIVVGFFWAPDGRTIAALELPGPGNNGVQAAAPRFVPALAGLTSARARTPDAIDTAAGIGLHLAFVDVATAAVRSQRDVRVSVTFVNQLLPYFDQYALSHRFWAADSESLALPLVAADGTDQLVVIPANGSDPHPIPGRTIGFWSP
jgi:TolB protein